jgi:hypothetical protein
VRHLLKKTGLSGAFINLLRLPVDNFASGSDAYNLILLLDHFEIEKRGYQIAKTT